MRRSRPRRQREPNRKRAPSRPAASCALPPAWPKLVGWQIDPELPRSTSRPLAGVRQAVNSQTTTRSTSSDVTTMNSPGSVRELAPTQPKSRRQRGADHHARCWAYWEPVGGCVGRDRPVTPEAAGSSPVDPANYSTQHTGDSGSLIRRRQHVSKTRGHAGAVEQTDRTVQRRGTEVHIGLRRREIVMARPFLKFTSRNARRAGTADQKACRKRCAPLSPICARRAVGST